ncbi:MAG: patatin-like phospholipase family protein [Gammaproteobacteria bacterium]|nr:patatin-like phospholipase family protein [Gammaproteobacteria bacterium]
MNRTGKRVSLVLGSGGARGLAHIGVIQCLQARGFEIVSVAGASMGALVGGLYAAGKLDDYTQWVRGVGRFDILRLLDLSLGAPGLVKGERLISTLRELLGDAQIEALAIPFTAVATDLADGRELWLANGSLFEAIRASISIPLFFQPYSYRGRLVLDGGVVNPVPMAPVFKDHSDLIIAVNLNGPPTTLPGSDSKSRLPPPLAELVNRLPGRTNRNADASSSLGLLEVAGQALDAMQDTIARHRLASYPPDVLIEVPRNLAGVLEFHRATGLIETGYRLADEALNALGGPPPAMLTVSNDR